MRSLKTHVGVGILTFISFERDEKENVKKAEEDKKKIDINIGLMLVIIGGQQNVTNGSFTV